MIPCRKWNRLCVSYDFLKNQAQVAFAGKVSELVVEPKTKPNMNGQEQELLVRNMSEFSTTIYIYHDLVFALSILNASIKV